MDGVKSKKDRKPAIAPPSANFKNLKTPPVKINKGVGKMGKVGDPNKYAAPKG